MHNALATQPAEAAETEDARASLSDILRFAMMQRLCVSVTYNNMDMLLAPHMLWTKHGDLHVDAVTVERAGGVPKVLKLGTFKLAGLRGMALTSKQFVPQADFDHADAKYAEAPVAHVQR